MDDTLPEGAGRTPTAERDWHLWHTIYFAPSDPRLLVPKWKEQPVGRTFNFARAQTYLILAMLFAAPLFIWGAILIWL